MFKAQQISMGEGQSWEDVIVYCYDELIEMGIQTPFEDKTIAFKSNNELIMVHISNIIAIKYDKNYRTGKGFAANRIVLSGDTSYGDVFIFNEEGWQEAGIPYVLKTSNGVTAQMVFSNNEGTFITLDWSVTCICVGQSKNTIRSAEQIIDPVGSRIRRESLPDTINAQIKRNG